MTIQTIPDPASIEEAVYLPAALRPLTATKARAVALGRGVGPIEWAAWRSNWADYGNAESIDLAMILDADAMLDRIIAARPDLPDEIVLDVVWGAIPAAGSLAVARALGHDGALRVVPDENFPQTDRSVTCQFDLRANGEVTDREAEMIKLAAEVANQLPCEMNLRREAVLGELPPPEKWTTDMLRLVLEGEDILIDRWSDVIDSAVSAVEALLSSDEAEVLAPVVAEAIARLREVQPG